MTETITIKKRIIPPLSANAYIYLCEWQIIFVKLFIMFIKAFSHHYPDMQIGLDSKVPCNLAFMAA